MIRVLDSAGSTLVEWGRQQQQHDGGGNCGLCSAPGYCAPYQSVPLTVILCPVSGFVLHALWLYLLSGV